jgi:GntR family transcriptional regulator, rspAB operon transcriptional repressor
MGVTTIGSRVAAEQDDDATGDGRRVPAVERVLDHILAEMDAGRLRPGSRVNAARIAANLTLSVAPVREALSMLAGRGVLDLLPDRGAVMRPLTVKDVEQLWEIIAPVGGVGLDLAARAIGAGADPTDVEAAYQAICHKPLSVSPLTFILRLNDYHWAVNRLAGNPYVTATLECLGVPYWDRYLVELIDVHANIDGYLTNYRRMHEAVLSADGASARAVLHYHAAWSISLIRQASKKLSHPP